jgi:hypothetical protein
MERALEEVWPEIKLETLTKLNKTMKKQLDQYIKNKGGLIKY